MNFFILMLIIFGVLFFITKNKMSKNYIIIDEILICVPLLLFATFRNNFRFMGDTTVYIRKFKNIPINFGEFINYFSFAQEFGYTILQYIIKIFYNNVNFLFFICAFLVLFLISWTNKKYSCNYLLSMFLFVFSNSFYSWICNGIKQGIAASIIFASLPFILKKKIYC